MLAGAVGRRAGDGGHVPKVSTKGQHATAAVGRNVYQAYSSVREGEMHLAINSPGLADFTCPVAGR